MEQRNPLGTEKISKLLMKFSIPAIIGMLVNALYNIVDRIYIGNSDLGPDGLGAINIALPLMIILMSFGILLGIGGITLFSMRLGQKKPEDAEKALGNAFILMLISGIILTIFGQIFLIPILELFGAKDLILVYAIDYMRIIFIGSIFQVVSMGLNNFIRADGSPKIAMLTMLLGAGINIILDPIFIYGFHMGTSGAALATILSQMVTAIWVILYFVGKRSNNKLRLSNLKLELIFVKTIIIFGLPGFLLQLASSVLNAVLNYNLTIYGGEIALSGMGAINSLQMLLLMPIIGLNQGVQPIISFNYGAKQYNRVKKAVKQAVTAATIICIVGFIITRLFPEQLISVFNRKPEMLEFGNIAVQAWFLFLPVIGFQIIAANFFQAIGQARSAIFLTLTRQVILLIPAILIFPKFWGLNGILHAAPFSDFFSTILTGVWFFNAIRKLEKQHIQITSMNTNLETTI